MKMVLGPLALSAFVAGTTPGFTQASLDPGSVPVSTAEQGVEQSLPRLNPEEAALPSAVIEFPTQQPPANSGTLSFVLTDLVVEGPEILPPEDLRPIYADMLGKQVTLLQAFDVLARVQAAHRDAGYVFTRVVAPPQEIDGGVFKIQVIEAFVGKVLVEEPEGAVGAPLPLIKKIAGQLEGVRNPTLDQLERTLLLLNDIPGLTQATAVPRPGDGLGAVNLHINVVRDPFSGVFFADNRQSPVLGPLILGASVEASSWSAAGDTTTLSFFNTAGDELLDDFAERNILQLEHQRHIGSQGTTVKLRALASLNRPGDLLEPLDISGEQFNIEATVEHPIVRTRPLSIWTSIGVEAEENEVETQGGQARIVDDSLRVAYIGARLLQRDDHGYTRADVQLRQGLRAFGASKPGTTNLSRFDGDTEFTVLRGSIDREILIPYGGNRLSVFASALGQVSSDPLLSSEEFAVGGQQISRAYDPSEFTGDSGAGALWELRYQTDFDIQDAQIGAQFYGYGDVAEVHNRGNAIGSENLKSYGGGVRLSLPSEISLSGEVAIPKQRLQRNNERKPRFFFNFVKRF
jgi:hemolysin activation/secretion protein